MRLDCSIKKFRRFVQKIEVCEHGRECKDCCWLWLGSHTELGYPRAKEGEKWKRATRIAWALFCNKRYFPPDGLFVLHSCDNPGCINYHHLFVGTHDDNMEDMVRKHRGGNKLDVGTVREIRRVFASHVISIRDLAEMFSIHPTAIRDLLFQKTWKYVNDNLQGTILGILKNEKFYLRSKKKHV